MHVREFISADISQMIRIWNEIVEEGNAFPQEELLDEESGRAFFAAQTYTGCAEDDDGNDAAAFVEVVGTELKVVAHHARESLASRRRLR